VFSNVLDVIPLTQKEGGGVALARVLTCALIGLDGAVVECEVDISPGLFRMDIVGLPDAAVQEAKGVCALLFATVALPFPITASR
jgi:magnesium chelatase family protein